MGAPLDFPIDENGKPTASTRRNPADAINDEFARRSTALDALLRTVIMGSDSVQLSPGTAPSTNFGAPSVIASRSPSFAGTPGYGPDERAAARATNDRQNYLSRAAGLIDATPRREYALDGTDITGAPKDRMGTTITPSTDFSKVLTPSKVGEGGLANQLLSTRKDSGVSYVGSASRAQPLSPSSQAIIDAQDRIKLNAALRLPIDRIENARYVVPSSTSPANTTPAPAVYTPQVIQPKIAQPVQSNAQPANRVPLPQTPYQPAPSYSFPTPFSQAPVATVGLPAPLTAVPPVVLNNLPPVDPTVAQINPSFSFTNIAQPAVQPVEEGPSNEPTRTLVSRSNNGFSFTRTVTPSSNLTPDELDQLLNGK